MGGKEKGLKPFPIFEILNSENATKFSLWVEILHADGILNAVQKKTNF